MDTSVPCKFMLDIEYSVIKSDIIKSFDCIVFTISPIRNKCDIHVLSANIHNTEHCKTAQMCELAGNFACQM